MENLPCGSAPPASWEAFSNRNVQISRKPAIASQSRVFYWKIGSACGGVKMKESMNTKNIPTRFEPDERFEIRPEPPAPFRTLQENEFEKLKAQLLEERLAEDGSELSAYLRSAANEAASLAWVTAYPLLVFPALFEEKATAASVQAERQQRIRQRSSDLLPI
jgi:hypothetical protein